MHVALFICVFRPNKIDETLPIIKSQNTHKKKGIQKKQNGRPMSKKTKEPPYNANHKGNIKFSNPLISQEAYQVRKREDLSKGCLT
jgi:hypothetical protein